MESGIAFLRRAAAALGFVLLALTALPAPAGLPAAMDGEPIPSLAPMLREATPAVVNIKTRGTVRIQQNPLFADPFFRRFFDLPPVQRERQTQSVGSGVIIDAAQGYVITNNHVIANADEIFVRLRDRREFTAELIGTDPDTDIAVLRIPAEDLDALPLGDSDALQVGDFVVAIGNPFGIGQTVTSGIVSALRRSGLGIEGFEDFIQTDASINPGNSGGALVTLRGELIGINTAIIGPSGGNVGIGFAIPINMARQVMDQLVRFGEVRRGRLGVRTQDLTPDIAAALGLERTEGAMIARVAPESPAAQAGIEQGDIVVEVDGAPIRDSADLRNRIGLVRVGRVIEMTVLRDGDRLNLRVEVREPRRLTIERTGPARKLSGATFVADPDEGIHVAEVEAGSPAARLGLRKQDIIVAVNRRKVRTLDDFEAAIQAAEASLELIVRRGNRRIRIVIR